MALSRVLITGARGLLGPYLVGAFSNYNVLGLGREDGDLTDIDFLINVLNDFQPNVVIHAAAETNVDCCEDSPWDCLKNNSISTANIASCLVQLPNTRLVFISTDQVYPDTIGPHKEHSIGPVNWYGKSKVSAEKMLRGLMGNHLILRTNFFGPSKTEGRKSFSDFVIESLKSGSTAIFFNDIFWTPLHMQTLSEMICGLVESDIIGTYNLGSSTIMSKAAFAGAVAERLGILDEFNKAAIGPASFKVKRPKDMSLDCSKIEAQLGWKMPTLEEEIKKL